MHLEPISSALTKDNRSKARGNHGRERKDTDTTSRCVVWPALKLILLPRPAFFLLSVRTKGPAWASCPDNRGGWMVDSSPCKAKSPGVVVGAGGGAGIWVR